MKTINISAVVIIAGLSFSCQNNPSIDELNTQRIEIEKKHKEELMSYKKELQKVDSLIANHSDSSSNVVKIKTVPVTLDTVNTTT